MPVWTLRPRFDRNGDSSRLDVEIQQIDSQGAEIEAETLSVNRASQTEILQTEGLLEQLVQGQVEKGRQRLILDLRNLQKADSAHIGEIVAAVQRTRAAGGTLLLANPTEKVRELFRRTELDRMLPVYESLADARLQFEA